MCPPATWIRPGNAQSLYDLIRMRQQQERLESPRDRVFAGKSDRKDCVPTYDRFDLEETTLRNSRIGEPFSFRLRVIK